MAVCIICFLLYILKCSRCTNLILVYRSIIFICDAVTICRDYIIVTSSTFRITGKDDCCLVSSNIYFSDHRSIRFFIFCFSVCNYCLGSCVVFGCAVCFYCICSVSVLFRSIFCSRNWEISI